MMMDVDQAAKATRDEEMLGEIEDFIEGFNQPTFRGIRVKLEFPLGGHMRGMRDLWPEAPSLADFGWRGLPSECSFSLVTRERGSETHPSWLSQTSTDRSGKA
jgi:hypothetical protein